MEELITLAAKNGIWTLLSIFLLFYVLNTTQQREDKYIEREEEYRKTIRENQELNKELAQRLQTMDLIYKDINDIKVKINTRKESEIEWT